MHSEDELKRELSDRWQSLIERVKRANSDFSSRLEQERLTFEFDADDDALMLAVGPRPEFVYTQSVGSLRLDLGADDRIVAITIEQFSVYALEHHYSALRDLASALRHLPRIQVSPGDRSEEVERELRDLVPA
jgi:hypothetical protein